MYEDDEDAEDPYCLDCIERVQVEDYRVGGEYLGSNVTGWFITKLKENS